MNDNPACNCEVWKCTCANTGTAWGGMFCHLHGTPHPTGWRRMVQRYRYWRDSR